VQQFGRKVVIFYVGIEPGVGSIFSITDKRLLRSPVMDEPSGAILRDDRAVAGVPLRNHADHLGRAFTAGSPYPW
jgi:hypothetical protein